MWFTASSSYCIYTIGCMMVSARKNDRYAVTFEVYVKADWPEKSQQKDDWTRPAMSQPA